MENARQRRRNETYAQVCDNQGDKRRREQAKDLYPGCETFADYKELLIKNDVDLVVNASYSDMHFTIAKDLLAHGKNVMTEKPFARNQYECEELIKTAKMKNDRLSSIFSKTRTATRFTAKKNLNFTRKAEITAVRRLTKARLRFMKTRTM